MTGDDGLSDQGLTSAGNTESVAEIVVAQWRPVDRLAQEAAGAVPLLLPVAPGRLLAEHDVLADWGYRASIGEMLDALHPIRDDLIRHHGCSLEDAVVLLHHLGVTMAPMAHPDRAEALHRFGYIATPWPRLEDLDGALARAIREGVEGADRATTAGIRAAVAALTATPEALTLDHPPYRRPFIRAGDTLIYDALGCHLPAVLTHETPFNERARQHLTRTFERQVHELLSPCGHQPFGPGTHVEEEGQRQTDLDASVVVDGMLVAIDCYSSPWTQALDLGEYRTTSNRAKGLLKKLAKWEQQWRRLAEGTWISGVDVDAVLPVVVTASAEWLGTPAEQPRFPDGTPRILNARELVDLLTHRPSVARDNAISVGAAHA